MTTTAQMIATRDQQLRELVNRAGALTAAARRARLVPIMRRARSAGYTLHAVREVLDMTGLEYIDAADAYISAGTKLLEEISTEVTYTERMQGVEAWCDRFGIQLHEWQRETLRKFLSR